MLEGIIKSNNDFYLSEYLGLKAEELTELRHLLEPTSSKYLVLKNSVARRALKNAGREELVELISGGTGMLMAGKDAIATVKAAAKFRKTHKSFKFKGGYLDGAFIDADKITYLASLPSRQELLTKIVYSMKAPISGFVGVLSNTLKSLVFAIKAIKEKKGG